MASRKRGAAVQSDRVKHLLIAPPLLFLLLLSLIPLLLTLGLSLTSMDISGKGRWIGVDNYIRLADDPIFIESYVNTLIFVAIGLPVQYFLGLGLAILVHGTPGGQRLWRLIIPIPLMVAPLVIGFIWKTILDSRFGPVNDVITALGRRRGPLDHGQRYRLHLDPGGRHLAVDALRVSDPLRGAPHAPGRAPSRPPAWTARRAGACSGT